MSIRCKIFEFSHRCIKMQLPIELIQIILAKINEKIYTTADINSAYNQMPLDKQSSRLTQFVVGNQQ